MTFCFQFGAYLLFLGSSLSPRLLGVIALLFLVAIASGQRVWALSVLCLEHGLFHWEPSGVQLVPGPGFMVKNQAGASCPVKIFMPKLSYFSSVEEDKTWCPIRTL